MPSYRGPPLDHIDSAGHLHDLERGTSTPQTPHESEPSEERTLGAQDEHAPKLAEKGPAAELSGIEYEKQRLWPGDIVTFDSKEDPENPKNWPPARKMRLTLLFGSLTMCATYGSSSFSSAVPYVAEEYGVSQEVAILAGVSFFVLAFALGPLLWASVAEVYGRKISVMVPMFIFMCFTAATASAENFQTIALTRFFGGLFAVAPVTTVGGALADLYEQRERGAAVVLYSLAVVCGPPIGPVVSSAVSQYEPLGWRWSMWLTLILTAVVWLICLRAWPETCAPVLLTWKARRLRLETGRWALHSKHEMNDFSLHVFVRKNLVLPLTMLVMEPMCLCITAYNSFAYANLYALFASIPIVYEEGRGWLPVPGTLPLLSVLVGALAGAAINFVYSVRYFAKRLDEAGGSLAPEYRLPPMALGSVTFPIGFFLFAWTSSPDIHWFPSIVGLVFIGASFLLIFQSGLNYLLDTYTSVAGSAVAANTFMRSLAACVLPFVTPYMYHNLGTEWGSSLLGFISIGLAAVPFIFMRYGAFLRGKSRTLNKIRRA